MTFREVKRHLQKPDQTYSCGLLCRGSGWVILTYVSDRPASVAGRRLKPGTTTAAYYADGEGWVLWKMNAPDGTLLGHLFHIVRDLCVGEGEVSYTDLILDLWVEPGEVGGRVLDEEELSDEVAAGRVPGEDEQFARERLDEVVRRADDLIIRLDHLLAGQSF